MTRQFTQSKASEPGVVPALIVILLAAFLLGLLILGNMWVWTEVFT